MARGIDRLTALKVGRKMPPGMHCDGAGLYLCVTDDGEGGQWKSWIFRYKSPTTTKTREMGLGPLHTLPLALAREAAAAQRRLILKGLDPLAERERARTQAQLDAARTMTFRACAEAFIEAHGTGWRSAKHREQWRNTLVAYAFPVFGDLPVNAIDTPTLMKALRPIWTTKPETAARVRGRIESVLDWATTSGYRTGENPARWRGHIANLLPKRSKVRAVQHHEALPYAEMANFMAELRKKEGVSVLALEFTILTAGRTGEVIEAKFPEIDDNGIWNIPADRMKAGKPHRVPLSPRCIEIVEEMRRVASEPTGYVFPGAKKGKPLSNMAMLQLVRGMRPGLTVHGFRSSFKDWSAERTDFPSEVVEMALAHTIESKVEAAYGRGEMMEKRRQLMMAWEKFCDGQGAVSAQERSNVVALAG